MLARRENKTPKPPSLGLVFSIPMEFGSTTGNILFDETGGGFNGMATNSPVARFPGFEFTVADSSYIDIGTGPTSVKTISFWAKPDDVAGVDPFIDLNGTDIIKATTGTVGLGGFSGGITTPYIDAVVGTATITANWHHMVVTSTTARNASNFDIARVQETIYFDGLMADVRLYDVVLSAARISDIYQLQRHRYQT